MVPIIVAAAVVRVAGAAGAYFWPAAAAAVAGGAMMNAPGAPPGFLISHALFDANPQLYFELLRNAGPKAAAAAFA